MGNGGKGKEPGTKNQEPGSLIPTKSEIPPPKKKCVKK
jgi:hypothetical protein